MNKKLERISPLKVIPADYNPRELSEKALKGLTKSMNQFGDLSGITWNQKTGNLVSGHQRWKKIASEVPDLDIVYSHDDRYQIISKKDGYLGFDLRVVNWPIEKEKKANISANNHAISGEWDKGQLMLLLGDIKGLGLDEYAELNLDLLEKDMGFTFLDEWQDPEKSETRQLSGMPGRIIIECPEEIKDEVLIFIKGRFLETSFDGIHIK
jgi:hypothetical protein